MDLFEFLMIFYRFEKDFGRSCWMLLIVCRSGWMTVEMFGSLMLVFFLELERCWWICLDFVKVV